MIKQYKKKPVTIEAIQLTPDTAQECYWFVSPNSPVLTSEELEEVATEGLHIETLEGVMHASINDWIIKGVHGEFYPCKPDIFNETYDAVDVPENNILNTIKTKANEVYEYTLTEEARNDINTLMKKISNVLNFN